MIELLEIRNRDRAVIGIIDTARSVIWNTSFAEIGDFEIYVQATPEVIPLLAVGNYVTRPDNRNVGLIEEINISYDIREGQMITASGRFAKSILTRRLIYNLSGRTCYPVISSGNVEVAMRSLVTQNIISAKDPARNISFFELGALAGITKKIVDANGKSTRKQTTYGGLQEYTDGVLLENGLGSYVGLDRDTLKLQYHIYEGMDRTSGNKAGNAPLVFSQEFDNLSSSDYFYEEVALKNTVLVGGEGEGTERFYTVLASSETGIDRREVFVDGSSQSRKYQDDGGVEQSYSEEEYDEMLLSLAEQNRAQLKATEGFSAVVDITTSGLRLDVDFSVGDIVTVQDNQLGKYVNTRIMKATEVQDESGYNINIEFGE